MIFKTLIERLQEHTDIRPCIYARVSTRQQLSKGFSLESQIERSEQAMEWYDIKPSCDIIIYSDGAKSGSNTDRNDLQQMKRDIKSGVTNLVLVTATDRVGREIIDNMEFRKFVIENKAEMLFINNPSLDIYTLEGGFQYGLDSLIGWRELKATRQRAVAGIIKSFENGNYANPGCPYGYDKYKSKNAKGYKLKINEEHAEVVRLIHELYLRDGYNVEKVASYLRINKIAVDRKWNHDIIRKILRSTVYCDIIVRDDLNRTFAGLGIAPVIISIDTKKQVHILLKQRARSHKSQNKHIFYTQVVCSSCKNICTNDTVKNRQYRYYHCRQCNSRYAENQLEEEIAEQLTMRLILESNTEMHEKMKRQLKRFDAQLKSATDLYNDGEIIRRYYNQEKKRIKDERREYLKGLWESVSNDFYWFSQSIKQKQKVARRRIKLIDVDMVNKSLNNVLWKN